MNTFSMTLDISNNAVVMDLKTDGGAVQLVITPIMIESYMVHANNTRSLIYTHRSSYRAMIDELSMVYGSNFANFYNQYIAMQS